MGLQLALCGVVGGVVIVKLAANDLIDKLRRQPHTDVGDPEADGRFGDEGPASPD
jgi:hypothetical protein